ncbi:Retrovirus-related Pol polyprotein from transposon 297 [Araneus ventricosus]|uniref:Retrovirus-related Pol polyprotein from transposon 297 n=1 Tax=Araneus ventricosus TaxID=182803 RepID=A0A4Y2AVU2_ARAVE|nr:Retrovirus-related Pol polyprotein from transposon 297 [Araneus ventricosus]
MMSTSDYMVKSTAYPFRLDPHHQSTENPQAFYIRQHHTENDVMEMSTLRHRNTQRFHFPYGTTDYLQQIRILKSFGRPERNYCVACKELLAIVKSIEHFRHYLCGQKFLLRTDHAFLRWLLNCKEPEGQIARWIQRLQEYDFEIQHCKGTSRGNADALSRRPCRESCKHCSNAEEKLGIETDTSVKVLTTSVDPWSSCEIQKAQLEVPAIKPILEKKLNLADRPSWQEIAPESPAAKRYWALWDSFHLKDGVLYRRWESDDESSCRWQLILPKSRIPEVLQETDDSAGGGHFGVMKTLSKTQAILLGSTSCRR